MPSYSHVSVGVSIITFLLRLCVIIPYPRKIGDKSLLPLHLQSRQRPSARPKLLRLNAKPLQHIYIKIAQRRRVLRVEVKMLAVLEAAAGEQHGQVAGRMAAAFAEVAAEENRGVVQQRVAVFFRL